MALDVIDKSFPERTVASISPNHNDLRDQLISNNSDVIQDHLNAKIMHGKPMHIYLHPLDDVTPKRVLTARSIPIHWQEQAEKEIHRLVNNGILAKVEMPTEYLADFLLLNQTDKFVLSPTSPSSNKHVQRPVHPFPSPQEIISSIDPSSKVFAKLDCVSGYHQIPLDEESSYLTTMLLPSGRYRYLRAPMGLNASSDDFCRHTDWALQGLNGVLKLVDDIIVFAPSIEILKTRLNAVIERCQTNNIILSKKKFEIGIQVTFAGFIISDGGIRPDPKRLMPSVTFVDRLMLLTFGLFLASVTNWECLNLI